MYNITTILYKVSYTYLHILSNLHQCTSVAVFLIMISGCRHFLETLSNIFSCNVINIILLMCYAPANTHVVITIEYRLFT